MILAATSPEEKKTRMTYEQFKETISLCLKTRPDGHAWMQIQAANPDLPLRPHALSVRQLESDIGLKRERKCGKSIWSLGAGSVER